MADKIFKPMVAVISAIEIIILVGGNLAEGAVFIPLIAFIIWAAL